MSKAVKERMTVQVLYNLQGLADELSVAELASVSAAELSMREELSRVGNWVEVPEGADAETRGRLICPLTLKEICSGVPFLYLGTCGCVFSEAGLRSIATSPAKDDDEKDIWPNALPNSPWQGFNRSDPDHEEQTRLGNELEARRTVEGASKCQKWKKGGG
ncbi:hypothetical protein M422DRAFT_255245 [Sphaerobolus stellatus SS14]|uniref:Replication termination factor 2 n=1 Tax=Sphaerobolus stellatus (strain SS14) TaxID=990650 RepID=A0A0C9VJ67_SPHS4|nr:hypothetical protein M422DRAFT_255245 [Sphaerobolus stellatus SS14]